MTSNVTFIYPCITDDAVLTPTGAAWPDALGNLQDRRRARVARSADTSPENTRFDIGLGERQLVGGIAIVGHNLTLAGRWRASVSLAPDMSNPVFDSGWVEAWGRVHPFGSLPWGASNWWDGRMSERTRKGYPGILLALLPNFALGHHLRIEIEDPDNPDGYIELGRLFAGEAWSPQFDASQGATIQWSTETTADAAIDGTAYYDRREGLRTWAFQLEWLNSAEAFGTVFEMQRTQGIDKQILVMFEPDDEINRLRKSFLGTLGQASPIAYPFFGNHSTTLEIKESR